MKLVLRPPGRGGWAPLVLEVPKPRKELPLLPIEYRVGDRLTIEGRVFRVAKVLP